MLRGLAILAILFGSVGAFRPIPTQSPETSAHAFGKIKDQSGRSQTPTPEGVGADGAKQAVAEKPNNAQKTGGDKPRQVSVLSIPTVTISQPQRSLLDEVLVWGPWAFTLLLVVVGGLQVWLLYRTWEKVREQEMRMKEQVDQIKAQATTMAEQTGVLKDSVDVAKKSAEAAFAQVRATKDRERARLTMLYPPEPPDFQDAFRLALGEEPDAWMELIVQVHNEGLSKAFDVRAWGGMTIQALPEPFAFGEKKRISIPDVIGDATPGNPVPIHIDQILLVKNVTAVKNETAFFFVYGEIAYKDVFGDAHRTPFRFLWNVMGYEENGQWNDLSSWENQSPSST
jgi:hypothetical protein